MLLSISVCPSPIAHYCLVVGTCAPSLDFKEKKEAHAEGETKRSDPLPARQGAGCQLQSV
ncbi:MAG: hypothetical protein EHJ95_01230 [Methanobacteriota archaeon]|nr:MAG: hypothetical protein EHJ95_01230 [Euryarchaeota archaeon]